MKDTAFSWAGSALTWVTTMFQSEATFKMIQIILAIIVSAVTLAYTIWRWWKKSKEDGKITKEEIKEGIEIVADGAKEIADQVDKIKEAKKDGDKD